MSYPAPPPQPPPYGYGYPPAPPPPEHPQATTILVLGVVGLFCGLTGPFAWVMGRRAMTEIDASPGTYGGRSSVQIGYILGIVSTVLAVLGLLAVIAYVVLIVVLVGTTASTGTS